jgi:hypothetical protein
MEAAIDMVDGYAQSFYRFELIRGKKVHFTVLGILPVERGHIRVARQNAFSAANVAFRPIWHPAVIGVVRKEIARHLVSHLSGDRRSPAIVGALSRA